MLPAVSVNSMAVIEHQKATKVFHALHLVDLGKGRVLVCRCALALKFFWIH